MKIDDKRNCTQMWCDGVLAGQIIETTFHQDSCVLYRLTCLESAAKKWIRFTCVNVFDNWGNIATDRRQNTKEHVCDVTCLFHKLITCSFQTFKIDLLTQVCSISWLSKCSYIVTFNLGVNIVKANVYISPKYLHFIEEHEFKITSF